MSSVAVPSTRVDVHGGLASLDRLVLDSRRVFVQQENAVDEEAKGVAVVRVTEINSGAAQRRRSRLGDLGMSRHREAEVVEVRRVLVLVILLRCSGGDLAGRGGTYGCARSARRARMVAQATATPTT